MVRNFRLIAACVALLSAAPAIAAAPPGQLVSGYDYSGLGQHQISVDAIGRVNVIGSAAGGSIYGNNAAGTAPTQPPVYTGGWDGTLVRPWLMDTSGRGYVNINGIPSVAQSGTWNITNVSGTVSLPTGASTAANQTSIIGSAAAGTAATNSLLDGGVYNSTAPTLTNGQQVAAQYDNKGAQYVSPFAQASGKTAVTGTCTATTNSAAFTPIPNRGINITLSGTFSASEVLQRSFDGGTTWFPITIGGSAISYNTAVSELAWSEPESGVQIRLACTWVSGTVTYRISQ